MPNLTAAEYAAILDPERKVQGWWDVCLHCDMTQTPMLSERLTFTGPDDLHTAREHAWRGEDWLEARGYSVRRTAGYTAVYTQGYPFFDAPFNMSHQNHAAAIAEAVRRIANG